ncbi:condensation domain-containing protein, partial [Bacillus altitudinis]|uniref:condensation domain-containing protein n=1 Tax=Bacillus altitudinis TaxID=293387 RepID=UPI0011A7607B
KAIQSFIRAFELDIAPLCRFGLVHLTENKYLLLIDMHHIISDGVSMDIFMRELRSLYHQIPLEPIEIQ